jgi:hypothetical protein
MITAHGLKYNFEILKPDYNKTLPHNQTVLFILKFYAKKKKAFPRITVQKQFLRSHINSYFYILLQET